MTTHPLRRATDRAAFRHRLQLWLLTLFGLLALAAALSWMVVHEDRARERERVAARLFSCQEIEKVKAALRTDLREQIREDEEFLAGTAGLPIGLLEERIRRSIERDRRTLASLQPYPGGCTRFATDPLTSERGG